MTEQQKLAAIRDDLFNAMPTWQIDAFTLIRIIADHLRKLDDYIDLISATALPESEQDDGAEGILEQIRARERYPMTLGINLTLEAMRLYAAQCVKAAVMEKDRDVQVLMSALGYTVTSDTPSILSDGTIPINGIGLAMERMLMSKDQELAAWKKQSAQYKAQIETLRTELEEAKREVAELGAEKQVNKIMSAIEEVKQMELIKSNSNTK